MPSRYPSKEALKRLFEGINGTDTITAVEFGRAFTGKRKEAFRDALDAEDIAWKEVLSKLDDDHNGAISFEEFWHATLKTQSLQTNSGQIHSRLYNSIDSESLAITLIAINNHETQYAHITVSPGEIIKAVVQRAYELKTTGGIKVVKPPGEIVGMDMSFAQNNITDGTRLEVHFPKASFFHSIPKRVPAGLMDAVKKFLYFDEDEENEMDPLKITGTTREGTYTCNRCHKTRLYPHSACHSSRWFVD